MTAESKTESKTILNNKDWKKTLATDVYQVCREKGTEPAFSGELLNEKRSGGYHCACCEQALFVSDAKFDSGSGWPSFFQKINNEAVLEVEDVSYGMMRTEVTCSHCDSHLGHVFPDGPPPTDLRFCINSLSLKFYPSEGSSDE